MKHENRIRYTYIYIFIYVLCHLGVWSYHQSSIIGNSHGRYKNFPQWLDDSNPYTRSSSWLKMDWTCWFIDLTIWILRHKRYLAYQNQLSLIQWVSKVTLYPLFNQCQRLLGVSSQLLSGIYLTYKWDIALLIPLSWDITHLRFMGWATWVPSGKLT